MKISGVFYSAVVASILNERRDYALKREADASDFLACARTFGQNERVS